MTKTDKTEATQTEAEKTWEKVRRLPLSIYGLPNQMVEQHCTVNVVEPSCLYVILKSGAVLPALEAALAPSYVPELDGKYVKIVPAPKPRG